MRTISAVALSAVALCWMVSPVSASGTTGYDPYAVGDRWEYSGSTITVVSVGEGEQSRSQSFSSTGTQVTEIVSEKERRPNGDVVYLVRTVEKYTGDEPDAQEDEATSESLDLVSKRGSFTTAVRTVDESGGDWRRYDPPLFNLPADPTPGKTWTVGTVWQDTIRFTDRGKIMARESLETPAGSFDDCLKVVLMHDSISGKMDLPDGKSCPVKSGRGMMTAWLARGVGIVRQEEIEQLIFDPGDRPICITTKSVSELLPGYTIK